MVSPATAPPPPPAAPTSPITGLITAAHLSFRQFLQGPRKWLLLLAGSVFPALLSVFVFLEPKGMNHPFLQLFDQLYLQGAILFIALLGAVPAFSSDVEDGTIVYLYCRPTPRAFIVVGKWLGCIVPLALITMIPVLAAWPLALKQVQPYETTTWVADPSGTAVPRGEDGAVDDDSGERRPGMREGSPGKFVTMTRPSHRAPAQPRELFAALFASAAGAVLYGTLFFSLGAILGRPYLIAMAYAVIVEATIGRLEIKLYVLSRFVRTAALRSLDPVPRFFEGSLEFLPPAWLGWTGIFVFPLVFLGAAAAFSTWKSYIGKGV
ncbi:MAG: ABC transporter permease [Candidatus Brocadiae bacterium]|nr:ABC transporter permease [Candidatus Brocadiia bacterium]